MRSEGPFPGQQNGGTGKLQLQNPERCTVVVCVERACQVLVYDVFVLLINIIITGFGHTQYRGKRFCPEAAGGLSKEDWVAQRKAEAAAAKAS